MRCQGAHIKLLWGRKQPSHWPGIGNNLNRYPPVLQPDASRKSPPPGGQRRRLDLATTTERLLGCGRSFPHLAGLVVWWGSASSVPESEPYSR